jgi:hypothetical protein
MACSRAGKGTPSWHHLGIFRLFSTIHWCVVPPRLPEQPNLYPVLSFYYAERIARDWNSKRADHGYIGYVTAFEVDDGFAGGLPVQDAGGQAHQELWVPAAQLDAFNARLLGPIAVVAKYCRGMRIG